jgi:hypothetical protein
VNYFTSGAAHSVGPVRPVVTRGAGTPSGRLTCGFNAWRPCLILEAVDELTTRLTGSTSNPASYAEGLAQLPVPFRVVAGDEVREAVRDLGRRLLAAG